MHKLEKTFLSHLQAKEQALRDFALGGSFIATMTIAIRLYKQHSIPWWLIGLLLFLTTAGSFYPAILRWPFALLLTFSELVQKVITKIIIFVIFIGVLTPISLVMKAFNHSFIETKLEPNKSSYWQVKSTFTSPKERYKKQF